ncbi:recombinational DNA repair ATPase RecF [Nocardia transvalensis]|uniref:Nuclease SbcCD subunit C n=1 Tax=Nocardia transvalensis TaxID=37333 RepID=A0A7W9PC69_9NOCA|nr:ATP-binding protein [Nocardia transvalensis]MBB5912983.1 recombinational DNA repair ATPase RecF [Nocardia transvalensis]
MSEPTEPAPPAEPLIDLVRRKVRADESLNPTVADAILRAFGDSSAPGSPESPVMSEIFLRSVTVHGFRGIGPTTRLSIQPSLGLTLIVGRNGSGKSSFAEAAEFALTGNNQRWANRSKIWQTGWRNLHDGAAPQIDIELQTQGADNPVTLTGRWDEGAELSAGRWTTRRGEGAPEPLDRTPLTRPLELFRPFLSYSELGALIDGSPSGMYDALHSLLGLDDLTDAVTTLSRRRLDLDNARKAVKRDREVLLTELSDIDDERARRVGALLDAPTTDFEAVSGIVLGRTETSGSGAVLSAVAAVQLPPEQVARQAHRRLFDATHKLAELATTEAESGARLVQLLDSAAVYAGDDDCECPVCGVGRLDRAWRERTRATVTRIREHTAALDTARREHTAALTEVRQLIQPIPPALTAAAADDTSEGSVFDSRDTVTAWQAWADLATADPAHLIEQLPNRFRTVNAALSRLREHARAELAKLDDAWSPLARRIAAWVDDASAGADNAAELKVVKAAEAWIKGAAAQLRNERMRPITEMSQQVWTTLRQQSNVELGGVSLLGNASSRKVELDVTVDGVAGAALGVMSQGELHALGLSLFLPRATAPESPFRFLMIDDPVQSMDPAKVDGLARVLDEVARTRQVIVFTHDLRLSEAVRRLRIPATVLDVLRRERSEVEVRTSADPVRAYIDDARALSLTRGLPREHAREMIALCCRSAIESACTARVRRLFGENGFPQDAIEEQLDATERTVPKLALAMLLDRHRESEVLDMMDREIAPWASQVVKTCNSGAHGCSHDDLGDLINRAERITKWISR